MGTDIIVPPAGALCINWSVPAETPSFLYCYFVNIRKGDQGGAVAAPNNHLFKLEQRFGSPCVWEYWDAAFGWWVQFGVPALNMWLFLGDDNLFPNYYFTSRPVASPPSEYERFTNSIIRPAGKWGYRGWATVFWMEHIEELMEAFGLDSLDDVKLEMFSQWAVFPIAKFCSIYQRTNVKIKYAP